MPNRAIKLSVLHEMAHYILWKYETKNEMKTELSSFCYRKFAKKLVAIRRLSMMMGFSLEASDVGIIFIKTKLHGVLVGYYNCTTILPMLIERMLCL